MPLALDPESCNAHCHVFGPRVRFPYAADAPFIPPEDAPKEKLYALNDRLGLGRCVVVQSSCHGQDNRATEDALRGRAGRYRGIALLRTDVADAELRRLDAAGFRGVRFNYMGHLGHAVPAAEVLALAARFADLGWHLQIHGDPRLLVELGPDLAHAPVPVVIDHIGRVDAALGMGDVYFQALLRLMENARFWVKVSGADRISRQGPPYADAVPFAQTLVARYPDRVVWGNDWPHPNHDGPPPDDAALVELIGQIAPDAAARRRLLVDNPHRLYRFAEAA
ncbi:MAG: amidohydrolase family protein [Rhodospirillales bacterium]|nr:amidohydrolase family protein [Rhodospirillales bacterium]